MVGSRVIERPQVLIEEYMAGHEISVHTWSHHASLVLAPVLLLADDTPLLAPYGYDNRADRRRAWLDTQSHPECAWRYTHDDASAIWGYW